MTLYVSEHKGNPNQYRQPFSYSPALATYSLSSASTAPFPSAGAQYIRVSADAPMLLNLVSTSTGVALSSTNALRIAANVQPELFPVSTGYRIMAQST